MLEMDILRSGDHDYDGFARIYAPMPDALVCIPFSLAAAIGDAARQAGVAVFCLASEHWTTPRGAGGWDERYSVHAAGESHNTDTVARAVFGGGPRSHAYAIPYVPAESFDAHVARARQIQDVIDHLDYRACDCVAQDAIWLALRDASVKYHEKALRGLIERLAAAIAVEASNV